MGNAADGTQKEAMAPFIMLESPSIMLAGLLARASSSESGTPKEISRSPPAHSPLPRKSNFRRRKQLRRLSALFGYALEQKWCQVNPVAGVKKVKASSQIGIITPEQFAKLLETANDETLPYWLIGGFAGLRRSEIERLEWKDVRFDSGLIEVPALKSKTASRRFVKIETALAAWLAPYKNRTGLVCPPDLRYQLELDRLTTGLWKPTANGIKQLKLKGIEIDPNNFKHLKAWPPNALRHSFASHHLAQFTDAARLALELGHTNQELLFRHYRELVTPDQAEKYWSIRPASQANLVALAAPMILEEDRDSRGSGKSARSSSTLFSESR